MSGPVALRRAGAGLCAGADRPGGAGRGAVQPRRAGLSGGACGGGACPGADAAGHPAGRAGDPQRAAAGGGRRLASGGGASAGPARPAPEGAGEASPFPHGGEHPPELLPDRLAARILQGGRIAGRSGAAWPERGAVFRAGARTDGAARPEKRSGKCLERKRARRPRTGASQSDAGGEHTAPENAVFPRGADAAGTGRADHADRRGAGAPHGGANGSGGAGPRGGAGKGRGGAEGAERSESGRKGFGGAADLSAPRADGRGQRAGGRRGGASDGENGCGQGEARRSRAEHRNKSNCTSRRNESAPAGR